MTVHDRLYRNPETAALPPGRWVPSGGILRYVLEQPSDAPARPMFCGTERGYQWHRYHDPYNWPLPPDDPCNCRAAHRAHQHFRNVMQRRELRQEAS